MTKPIRLIATVLAILTVGPTSAALAADGPPLVTTNAATAVGNTTAVLNGYVDANGKDATVLFEYGTTTGYGMTSASRVVKGDKTAVVYHPASSLTPGTVYHVRVRATSSKGTTLGADVTFTTTGTAPAPGAPAPAPGSPAPTLPGTPAPTVLTPTTPEPVQGESVVVAPTRGTVLVKAPGGGFVPLTAGDSVPVGSVVDTRAGAIALTSSVGTTTQTGSFRGGMFEVRQTASGNGMTDIVLRGGDFSACTRARTAAAGKKAPRRQLWSTDSGGRFRTHGRNSVATVRGTAWVTTETCAGTRTTVTQGAVSVRDLRRKKTVLVRAGGSYLAR